MSEYNVSICLKNERRRILLIGDSITQRSFSIVDQGWGAGLADWYTRTADVINRGYSGYNSRWLRSMISDIVPEGDINNNNIILTTIFLGANDAVDSNAQQYVPVDEYKDNLIYIIHHLKRINPNMIIIVITPPIVDNSKWNTRNISNVTKYANEVREICNELTLSLCDLWIEPGIELKDLNDGLHFGPKANKKLLNSIKNIIRKSYPKLVPEDIAANTPNLSLHYPHFLQVAGKSQTEAHDILQNWKWSERE